MKGAFTPCQEIHGNISPTFPSAMRFGFTNQRTCQKYANLLVTRREAKILPTQRLIEARASFTWMEMGALCMNVRFFFDWFN